MQNTEKLGPEYHHSRNRNSLRGRRFVWSRRKSKPWTLTLLVIGFLIIASSSITISYLVSSHPGKPEPNPGIETQTTR